MELTDEAREAMQAEADEIAARSPWIAGPPAFLMAVGANVDVEVQAQTPTDPCPVKIRLRAPHSANGDLVLDLPTAERLLCALAAVLPEAAA